MSPWVEVPPWRPDHVHLYVSGPMTGYPDLNHPAFAEATAELRAAGYAVTSPPELGDRGSWQANLKMDVIELLGCDAVATLEGWEESRGANLEVHVARTLGMSVQSVERWLVRALEARIVDVPDDDGGTRR